MTKETRFCIQSLQKIFSDVGEHSGGSNLKIFKPPLHPFVFLQGAVGVKYISLAFTLFYVSAFNSLFAVEKEGAIKYSPVNCEIRFLPDGFSSFSIQSWSLCKQDGNRSFNLMGRDEFGETLVSLKYNFITITSICEHSILVDMERLTLNI